MMEPRKDDYNIFGRTRENQSYRRSLLWYIYLSRYLSCSVRAMHIQCVNSLGFLHNCMHERLNKLAQNNCDKTGALKC